jgi:putative phosphoesterase
MSPRGRRATRTTVGLISDTHGLVRPEALEALRGSDLVIHAGDVGGEPVLEALRAIAPTVIAVRGNNDRAPWSFTLPETKRVEVGGVGIAVIHDVKQLAFEPSDERVAVVVFGHSHQPVVDARDGVLWVNPGSAGPRRFKLPVSVGRLVVERGAARAELITL